MRWLTYSDETGRIPTILVLLDLTLDLVSVVNDVLPQLLIPATMYIPITYCHISRNVVSILLLGLLGLFLGMNFEYHIAHVVRQKVLADLRMWLANQCLGLDGDGRRLCNRYAVPNPLAPLGISVNIPGLRAIQAHVMEWLERKSNERRVYQPQTEGTILIEEDGRRHEEIRPRQRRALIVNPLSRSLRSIDFEAPKRIAQKFMRFRSKIASFRSISLVNVDMRGAYHNDPQTPSPLEAPPAQRLRSFLPSPPAVEVFDSVLDESVSVPSTPSSSDHESLTSSPPPIPTATQPKVERRRRNPPRKARCS